MHLTLNSLKNIKNECDRFDSLEGLESAELRNELSNYTALVRQSVDSALEHLETIEQMKASLLKCGYSDEWFDIVNEMGFKTNVTLDLESFLSTKGDRMNACMEGFVESAIAWLKKIGQIIMSFINVVRQAIAKAAQWLNPRKYEKDHKDIDEKFADIEKHFDDLDRQKTVQDYFKKATSTKQLGYFNIPVKGWYDLEVLDKHVPIITEVLQSIILVLKQGPYLVNVDGATQIFEKLRATLQSKRIEIDRPELTGFRLAVKSGSGRSKCLIQTAGNEIKDNRYTVPQTITITDKKWFFATQSLFTSVCQKVGILCNAIGLADSALKQEQDDLKANIEFYEDNIRAMYDERNKNPDNFSQDSVNAQEEEIEEMKAKLAYHEMCPTAIASIYKYFGKVSTMISVDKAVISTIAQRFDQFVTK